MKRSPKSTRSGSRPRHLIDALSTDHFAGVGLFLMAYTELESVTQYFLADQLGLQGGFRAELVSRIQGFHDVTELIKSHAETTIPSRATLTQADGVTIAVDACKPQITNPLEQALAHATQLKSYRDAIAHAKVFDANSGIAIGGGGRKKTYEVWLSIDGLNTLYELCKASIDEISAFRNVVLFSYQSQQLYVPAKSSSNFLVEFDTYVQQALDKALYRQQQRKSLPPPPQFPK